jgi:uncharacterized 2Fe-2S/4Fe-4S cluster protein (DUF4445 family)
MNAPVDDALVAFQPSGHQARVPCGLTLLDAARRVGADIDSICGGRRTCGRCFVSVVEGALHHAGVDPLAPSLSPAEDDELACAARRRPGEHGRLACAARVLGDLVVDVPANSRARRPLVRKAAGERAIALDPAVRLRAVQVAAHQLGEREGDWQRLAAALAEQWQIRPTDIALPALRGLGAALQAGAGFVTVALHHDQTVLDVRPGFSDRALGLAVDLGSTTIAAHLCDLTTGAVLASESAVNPQVAFGEDLMSRVSYVMMNPEGLTRLQQAVIEALNRLAHAAASRSGASSGDILDMVIVGNTVMHQILLGIDPTALGAAPFTLASHAPLDLRAAELGLRLHPAAMVYCPALEAGHVGSDNVAVLLAERPDQADALTLVIDVGTNAEIVLGDRAGLHSCSSPTGPAFEGAQITHGQRAAPGAIERVRIDRVSGVARVRLIGDDDWLAADAPAAASGICGSGIIEVVAELLLAGIIQPDGRFAAADWLQQRFGAASARWLREHAGRPAYCLLGAAQTAAGHDIIVTQDDVRNVQLAKGALYAGCRVLLRQRGATRVERIVLAGAFGSYIDPLYAMALGLIPDCDPAQVRAAGNAAGDGARIMLLDRASRGLAATLARQARYCETAIDPAFQEEFVAALHLPHATDAFPHLAAHDMLPTVIHAPRERRARRQREGL